MRCSYFKIAPSPKSTATSHNFKLRVPKTGLGSCQWQKDVWLGPAIGQAYMPSNRLASSQSEQQAKKTGAKIAALLAQALTAPSTLAVQLTEAAVVRRCQVFCLFCCQLLYFVLSRFATTCAGPCLQLGVCVWVPAIILWVRALTDTDTSRDTHTHWHVWQLALRRMNEPWESGRTHKNKSKRDDEDVVGFPVLGFINSNLNQHTHTHTNTLRSNQWLTHTCIQRTTKNEKNTKIIGTTVCTEMKIK